MKISCHEILNNFILLVNFALSAFAVTCIVLAVYLLYSGLGTTDQGFFLGWCIAIILFGIIINQIIYTGTIGINYQKLTIGKGAWGIVKIIFFSFLSFFLSRILEWESHFTHLSSWYSLFFYRCLISRHFDNENDQIFKSHVRRTRFLLLLLCPLRFPRTKSF
jgi:hypothetical protein